MGEDIFSYVKYAYHIILWYIEGKFGRSGTKRRAVEAALASSTDVIDIY
jgi:hypothetical protein